MKMIQMLLHKKLMGLKHNQIPGQMNKNFKYNHMNSSRNKTNRKR